MPFGIRSALIERNAGSLALILFRIPYALISLSALLYTRKALAHFSRALYFGAKREADDMNVDTAEPESSSSKKGKVDPSMIKDVQQSLQKYKTFLALRETTTGLGAMGLGDRQQARPPAPASTFLAPLDITTRLGAMGLGDRQQARPPEPVSEGRRFLRVVKKEKIP